MMVSLPNRRWRFATALILAGLLSAPVLCSAGTPPSMSGGGFHGGGGARAGFSHGAYAHGYTGRGFYGHPYYGWRGSYGWHGYWWGPGWWGLGVFLPILPWYYSTYWWDGVPYYYTGNAYYVWNGGVAEYEQVSPPAGFQPGAVGAIGAATGEADLYAYPKSGQSADQQARDREECRHWAADQNASPAPPTAPAPPVAGAKATPPPSNASAPGADSRQALMRAEAACLEGRGYSVR